VYLEGGRHWRLADPYLGTLTLKKIFGVLDRGGVVMGGSAGATIQGSYMVRGSSNPDDNTIMMAPGHEVGFGLITNVTIDQHVDTRGRENDLAPVMKMHPELLGIGLDESTSITVHGNTLTCNGPRRAAIWDGKNHDGKGYYYLHAGDSLDLVTHVATFVAMRPTPGIRMIGRRIKCRIGRRGQLGSLINFRPPPSMSLIHGSGFASSSGQSNLWTARNPSYRRSATFCVHEATLRWARTRRFCACNSFRSAWRRRLRLDRSEIWLIDIPGATLRFQNIV
jgi:hypothetical protein